MSRETFLAKVRSAAEAGRAYRVHHREIPPNAGYLGGGDDLVGRFASEVIACGGFAEVFDDLSGLRSRLDALVAEIAPRSALCWRHPLLERLDLRALLSQHGVEMLTHDELAPLDREEQRRRMFAAELGISSVTWAIAETGSAAVASGPGTERLASLLPPVYVTVVESAQILPDLFDLFAKFDAASGGELPTNLALITGPSKTGDIELKLTTGVHGPGRWHVLVSR